MKTLFLALMAVCAFLPMRYIVASLPALWMLQRLFCGDTAAIVSAGPVDVTPLDLLLLVLLARFGFDLVSTREFTVDKPLYTALALFLIVNLLASLAAGVKFGQAHSMRCVAAWARLVCEMMMLPILAQSIRTLPQARRCVGVLFVTLGALAAIQFINFFGASHGFYIGEVQGLERGEPRYFGPVGDSVGFVLLLGWLVSLCFANVIGVAAFLGGILFTAGLGAAVSVATATALFMLLGTPAEPVREFVRRHTVLLLWFGIAVIAAGVVCAKPLIDRLETGDYATSGSQRVANIQLATAMIADNPLLGVGFMGYERALPRYGGDQFFHLGRPDGATANANNQPLQTLTDAGVFGFLPFLALIACAARLCWRIATRCDDRLLATFYRAALLWLLTQLLGNLAAVWMVPSSYIARFLWIILGIAVAVQKLMPERACAEERLERTPELVPA